VVDQTPLEALHRRPSVLSSTVHSEAGAEACAHTPTHHRNLVRRDGLASRRVLLLFVYLYISGNIECRRNIPKKLIVCTLQQEVSAKQECC
jgi:hypothetical protein